MKVIIAGSRGVTDLALVRKALADSDFTPTEVVSGGARGVDQLGEQLAAELGLPVRQFIPNWAGYAGARAGFVRNNQMADYADALVAVWDGHSRGTAHMIGCMKMRMKPTHTLDTRFDTGAREARG